MSKCQNDYKRFQILDNVKISKCSKCLKCLIPENKFLYLIIWVSEVSVSYWVVKHLQSYLQVQYHPDNRSFFYKISKKSLKKHWAIVSFSGDFKNSPILS